MDVFGRSANMEATMGKQGGSQAAGTGAIVASVVDAGAGNTYSQITMKVNGGAFDSVVALETSPDGTTWTEQDRVTGPHWAYAAGHHARRFARANVVNLGAAAGPISAAISVS